MKLRFSMQLALFSVTLFQSLFLSIDCQKLTEDQVLPSDTPKTVPPIVPETTTFTLPTTTPRPPVIPRPPTTTPTIATTTLSTLHPPGSTINTVVVPSGVTTTPPFVLSSSVRPSSSSATTSSTATSSSSSTNSPIASSSSTSSTSSSASISPTLTPVNKGDSSDTPTIVGAVVGGIVGIALIGGILACISRKGGCTKKRKERRKKPDFEEYGLGDSQTQKTAPMIQKPPPPTIPRLNDQGNYYQDNYQSYNYPQEDYNAHNQQQGGYYYPQLQHQYQHQPDYYNDGGYYYDHNVEAASPTMYSNSPTNQHYSPQGYATNNSSGGYPSMYQHQSNSKPDDTTYRR
ncbi:hypothetical protein BY458DRAFT_533848 [Sporodiniella umbellata]|nr:hypothetical protein BY458DRAFT_533848 [Sporodiniella umbellata]